MAITDGISITCNDLQRTGGISQILLRSWDSTDVVTYGNAAGEHDIDNIQTGGSDADWFLYEFKDETPTLNIAATKENGSTAFECTLTFYQPKIQADKFHVLQEMLSTCMMGMVLDTNGLWWVIGASEKYEVASNQHRSQTFLDLVSMEGQTGAAYSEENGITITMMARQFELPRYYSGTVTVDTTAKTATTGA